VPCKLRQGRNIRFVHLPRSLNPAQLVDAQVRRVSTST